MSDLIDLTNMIYGEGADQSAEVMTMIGSSAIQRLKSGRTAEFGGNMREVLQKGYYAVSNPNTPYKQALSQKFPDQLSETKYKQAMSIASGLLRGTIPLTEGQFYFTDKEINRLKKNKKEFDFKKVKEVGKVGNYRVFKY